MSALPNPSPQVRPYPLSSSAVSRRSKRTTRQASLKSLTQPPTKLPVKQKPKSATLTGKVADLPQATLTAKLEFLCWFQQGSLWLAFTLVAASIGVYVSAMRIPQMWSKEYRNLKTLQRQERELTAINEILKREIAQQAQQAKEDLVPLKPDHVVFVTPATESLPDGLHPHKNLLISSQKLLARDVPLGY